MFRDMKTQMHFDGVAYRGTNGWVMRREHGLTPNGNEIDGRWVLRDEQSAWIDVNRYRNDIVERYGLKLIGRE